ncbi:hypothetical protein BU24DRAFT_375440 [Aaosphaeria arxii CBS 175.79]|uniref:SURF6-domain-containing protein n=1 Tax=Aaosphaeria arxii CBS 175.79 TaxID=1450172 RepID=A0A6A5XGK8_9PLEO|nr:uncharacterized protein BU24DRAFT_375440 [Aaosphaeria arxii CBS 175.79]KAF2012050.1 hypothetical protein BU24DRAFT_375440 [Aaosphaeria arxii CBS 175.79]
MADSNLEERLKSHARAFEGLMSLIPAKEYYGKDSSITSTQWSKKKQTKEERQAAKRAKLDPASHKTAKDVMDENARKRKRELEGEDSSSASSDTDLDMDIEKEKPLEGLRKASTKSKKQKTEGEDSEAEASFDEEDPVDHDEPEANEDEEEDVVEEKKPEDAKAKAAAEKRKQKLEKKKEKLAKKQQNKENKKALQNEFSEGLGNSNGDAEDDEQEEDALEEDADERLQPLDVSGLVEDPQSTAASSIANSNASTTSNASAASSSSSIIPPADASSEKKEEKSFKYDPKKHEAFRDRLAQKLAAMRAARKADGPDGRPARNRAELIESRRKKEAERKIARKASRQLAKEDEERLKAEEQLARLRGGSGSPSLFSLRPTPEHDALAFGRVAWKDGQQLDSNLSGFLEAKKRKGKSDAKTALEAAEKKRARINALDEVKRKDIEEKDMWLDAKKRAQGEKVHNDAALLKKSVKRQEKAKAKSKQEWKDRLTSVQKAQEAKQKKREENLKKRRDEKGSKKGKKGTKAKKPGKKVKRPGFEGTFKAR